MYWHYHHCLGRTVRGINLLNAVYYSADVSIPVAFEVARSLYSFAIKDVGSLWVKLP
jgi:hypothetical protein